MPPKLTRIHECQSASRLSAALDVMSIRRTDKHCGARLVAAPASLLFVLYPLLPLSVSLSLPSASKPAVCRHLQPSTLLSFPLSASRTAFSPFLRFSHLFLYTFYIYIYIYYHRHSSLLLSNSIRGASALASSDRVLTSRAGILRFHQLPPLTTGCFSD